MSTTSGVRPRGTTGHTLHEVRFAADDLTLAGHLRVPGSAGEAPLPALVMTGPLSGVKEQVTGLYAARLADRGFVTLAFDHRNFGASEGHRPQHEDAAGKLADLGAATSWLGRHEAVDADRLGCVGICMGGGYALRHAAFDRRIKALALVAAAFNDPRVMRRNIGEEGYRGLMEAFAACAGREHATGEPEMIATVAQEGEALMPGAEPFAYYGTERSAAPGWGAEMTRLSLRELLTFDAAMGADFVGPTPTLIVHGRRDDFCSPTGAQDAYDRIDGPKQLHWLDTTNHIDLYDVEEYVGPAVELVADWMRTHL